MSYSNKQKKIAITIGDPGGIGPEVVLKAITSKGILGICKPTVIGDVVVIEEAISYLKIPVNLVFSKGEKIFISPFQLMKKKEGFLVELIDASNIKNKDFEKCKPTSSGGIASVSYIKKAVELALNKEVDAIVTAPISKESLKMAGFKWPGHTEMLAELTNTKDYAMMFYSDKLKLILVTIHTALRNVPDLIKKEKVLKTILLTKKACDMIGLESPKIAVSALNPHAGEAEIFGDEEFSEIIPAVKEAQKMGISVSGPYPADSLFYRAYNGEFDIIVCMYHDQGLIPLKMVAFDKAVNVTVGLPIVRTSPDHGTAYDIAWKGIANPSSMIEAIKLSVKIRRR